MPHLRIKPFPAPVEMQYATNTWNLLRAAVEDILQKKSTTLSFEELYQHAYGMHLHKQGDLLQQNLQNVIMDHLSSRVRNDLLKAVETNFLQGLKQVWEDFSAGMLIIRDVFMYMDRKVESQTNDQPSVYTMGLILFRDTVLHYGQVRDKLQRTLLELISQERNGAVVDQPTIRSVCTMLMELGGGTRLVYEEDFEQLYLTESAAFFRAEAQKYLTTSSAGDFIRSVDRVVTAETERINQYLDTSTKAGIDKLIDEEMIQRNIEAVVNMTNGGVVALIQARQFGDMATMFKTFNRVNEGVPIMLAPSANISANREPA
ncbi:Cullin-3-B [Hypsibius exemplaris]|uniref:Cullin-3-B n=1 Tax=Hypsibius exemplaris TaxID=2072580 RepID=A0A1W0X001_HYPEX|nr:Cullin-3-B [Hypsibius exemplaris]